MRSINIGKSALVALALTVALALPSTAADQTVDISNISTVSDMGTAVYLAISNAKNTGGGTVTVTGTYRGAQQTGRVAIDIPANVTVKWQATYQNSMNSTALPVFHYELVELEGSGVFEMAGGRLSNSNEFAPAAIRATENVTVRVTGGEVFSQSREAIIARNDATVEITGGTVITNGTNLGGARYAINAANEVKISGSAEIKAPNTRGIYARTITMSGGSITSASTAITTTGGVTQISGGTISTANAGVEMIYVMQGVAVISGAANMTAQGTQKLINALSGTTVYMLGGNITGANGSITGSGAAYFFEKDRAMFATTTRHAIDNVTRMEGTLPYIYNENKPAQTVTATLANFLDLTAANVTVQNAAPTYQISDNKRTVTFSGVNLNSNEITVTVTNAKLMAGGKELSLPEFKTPPFGIYVIVPELVPVPSVTETGLVYNGLSQSAEIISADPAKYTVTMGSATNAGEYTATVALIDKVKYAWETTGNSANLSLQWSIAKAPLTVKADDKSIYTNASQPTYTYTATGFVNNQTAAVFTTPPSFSLNPTFNSAVPGAFTITPSGGVAANYYVSSYETGTLTVNARDQEAPPPPTMASRTLTSITLNEIHGAEYRLVTSGAWQNSPTFSGLTSSTGYKFQARMRETSTYHASPPSKESEEIFTVGPSDFEDGDGTETSPYIIVTKEQLELVRAYTGDAYAGVHFKLGDDIDLNGDASNQWTPIGTPANLFQGTFDGAGFVVRGLYIDWPDDNQGLFGWVDNCVIKNLGVEDAFVKGGNGVGGLVGNDNGVTTIINSYSTGSVEGVGRVGGLVGSSNVIINSYSTASVKAGNYVGGLAGIAETIVNSYATGDVKGTSAVGGLAGHAGTIVNSYATGDVTGTITVGRLAGVAAITVNSYYNSDAVYNQSDPGEGEGKTAEEMKNPNFVALLNSNALQAYITSACIWGYLEENYPVITNIPAQKPDDFPFAGDGTQDNPWIISTKETMKKFSELGLEYDGKHFKLGANIALNDTTGWKNWGTNPPQGLEEWKTIAIFRGTFDGAGFAVSGVYAKGDGLFGMLWTGATIKNLGVVGSYVSGSNGGIGVLVGYNLNGSIINCYATGNVVAEAEQNVGHGVGGLVGINLNGTITNSHATVNVKGSGTGFQAYNIGGLVGENFGGTITNSYATGNVEVVEGAAGSRVGGLVGENFGGTISNSYATGDVEVMVEELRDSFVGGLVGINSNGTISNSYATGDVEVVMAGHVGGLVGENFGGTITNSYATGNVEAVGEYIHGDGGLVGSNSGAIEHSYYNEANENNDFGTPKSIDEMKQILTFTGWDFTSIWRINEGNDYPRLGHLSFSSGATFTYNSSQQKFPASSIITKSLDGSDVFLLEDVHYTAEYDNSIDAGENTASVTFTVKDGGQPDFIITHQFTINRKPIPVPETATLVYNGNEQTVEGEGFEATGNGKTDVGAYTATLAPDNNHKWNSGDNETGTRDVDWNIAPLSVIIIPNVQSKQFGDAEIEITELTYTTFPEELPESWDPEAVTLKRGENSSVGDYLIEIDEDNSSDNYVVNLDHANAFFSITRIPIAVPTAATNLVYTGGFQSGVAMSDEYEIIDGVAIDVDDYTATITPGENYQWNSGADRTAAREVSWSIAKLVVTITPELKQKEYGDADPALTYITEPLELPESWGTSVITLKRAAGEAVGTYPITIDEAATEWGDNYAVALSNTTVYFTIAQANTTCDKCEDPDCDGTCDNTPIIAKPHTLYPIPHTPVYYNLRGEPLGIQKPTVPGVYIEKRGKYTQRIIVR